MAALKRVEAGLPVPETHDTKVRVFLNLGLTAGHTEGNGSHARRMRKLGLFKVERLYRSVLPMAVMRVTFHPQLRGWTAWHPPSA